MPELPDVEGFRRVLATHAGDEVRDVEVLDAQVLRGVSTQRLGERVRGHRLGEPRRHGKWLIAPLSGGPTLLLHFGMTGTLVWSEEDGREPHDRVVFVLPGGELRFRDQRKLQGIHLADDASAVDRILTGVGPDATAVTRADLAELLGARRRQVKAVLTDQSLLSGLGNLLADEILWRARINPRRQASSLTDAEIGRLHARMRSVIRQAVPTGRVPPRKSWLTGRRDDPAGTCPRCGTPLSRGRAGGRGTVWCPRCQPD
ncbi:Fpg/Nei family DNA glycosylase [Actinophytocola sp.]|uniref:Fpg/Nei family DNA glycosylase n=1 Tax=Actinophytocola sp. TaxID=1872138 RepID=UPI002EDB031D